MRQQQRKWFRNVFGFSEPKSYDEVRGMFRLETMPNDTSEVVLHTVNNEPSRSFYVGKFETPSIRDLKEQLVMQGRDKGPSKPVSTSRPAPSLTFRHFAGDVGKLHTRFPNAVFQAASQFNCLEMTSPDVTPEAGVTGYVFDHTQGPVCALACPAGTVFRNYFVNGHGQGGTNGQQVNCLRDIELAVDNDTNRYWSVQNGYSLPCTTKSMAKLSSKLLDGSIDQHALRDLLRVGVHWSTSVVDMSNGNNIHNVTQVYVSAVPVGYHKTATADWEPYAQLILDGLYEATLVVGAIRARQLKKRVTIFLTMVGGGVFANPKAWIIRAIGRALNIYRDENIDVVLVHYNHILEDYAIALPEILPSRNS